MRAAITKCFRFRREEFAIMPSEGGETYSLKSCLGVQILEQQIGLRLKYFNKRYSITRQVVCPLFFYRRQSLFTAVSHPPWPPNL